MRKECNDATESCLVTLAGDRARLGESCQPDICFLFLDEVIEPAIVGREGGKPQVGPGDRLEENPRSAGPGVEHLQSAAPDDFGGKSIETRNASV